MEGQQISIWNYVHELEKQRLHIKHCLRSYKASCKPWKKEYWKNELSKAIAKFHKEFPGYEF